MRGYRANDIAIIGMGCRFPGGANNYQQFWQLLLNRFDAITPVPNNRWDVRKFYHDNNKHPAKTYLKEAGFIDQPLDEFDPLFFGISPREAETLDPQQRLLLEVCYESVEDAGLSLDRLRGSVTSVYIGGFCLDNQLLQLSPLNRELIDSHNSASSSMTMLASRLSYFFDLKGPCLALDTACSSSLVAIHYACHSILHEGAEMAIAGGVNAILKPEYAMIMSKGQFLSPDARCKTFDVRANGYARGEGAGIIILKSLQKALADNDRIHAVIAATGVNQDGQTVGITLPNGQAQQALMREVYKKADVSVEEVGYIEAHGTGTQAGDVTEVNSINALFGQCKKPVYIGSVKTNIGHLEAAAGVAGVIKTVLCLKHKKIPANLHFETPNPSIHFQQLKVPTETQEWRCKDETYYASVNSFGYGGTNAHALLTVLQTQPSSAQVATQDECIPVVFSAMSKERLSLVVKHYIAWLKETDHSLQDIAYTLNHKKTHFNHRLIALVKSKPELIEKLQNYLENIVTPLLFVAQASVTEPVFVFTGMGPQWARMGKMLFECEPIYREQVLACDQILRDIAGISILDELFQSDAETNMHEPRIAQIANFILQVSLSALLLSKGIKPVACCGHSVGEIAAFYLSGALSLQDALLISYHRSCLQNTLLGSGEMLAVNLGRDKILPYLDETISIAAENSPSNVTLSGEKQAILALSLTLTQEQIFNRVLNVNLPYHSQVMESIKEDFLHSIAGIQFLPNHLPLYSTVTGKLISTAELSEEYWWQNAREAVEFNAAVTTLLEDGFNAVIEIGPHPVLKHYLSEIADHQSVSLQLFHTLNRRQVDERECLLSNLCEMYSQGIALRLETLHAHLGRFIDTPLQSWLREKYWRESVASKQDRMGVENETWIYQERAAQSHTFQVELSEAYFPYLAAHKVVDLIVFPAASYIEAALLITHKLFSSSACLIEDMRFKSMLIHDKTETQMLTARYEKETNQLIFSSASRSLKEKHCSALLYPMDLQLLKIGKNIEVLKDKLKQSISVENLYQHFKTLGLVYGDAFQTIQAIYLDDNEVLVKLHLSNDQSSSPEIHPALLDGAFQALLTLQLKNKKAYLPHSINKILFYKPVSNTCWAHATLISITEKSLLSNVDILDEAGDVCMQVMGVRLKAITQNKQSLDLDLYYAWQWQQTALSITQDKSREAWLIFHDGTQNELLQRFKERVPYLISVRWGEGRLQISETDYQLSRHELADYEWLWGRVKPHNIVSLMSPVTEAMTVATFSAHLWPIILLAKSLSHFDAMLFFLTYGAQSVSQDICDLASAPITQLARVIENEYPMLHVKTIDTDEKTAKTILLDEVLQATLHDTVAYRENLRFVKRLERAEIKQQKWTTLDLNDHNVELTLSQPGVLDSLQFIPTLLHKPKANEVQIKVYASAINFKDILKLTNKLEESITENTFFGDSIGMEIAGVITEVGSRVTEWQVGDAVIAPLPQNFSSYAYVDERYLLRKPKTLSFTEAPVLTGYFAAYYGLVNIADIKPCEKVLIHNATGGVGLAAIQLAQWKQAEIYATAGTDEKRAYLRELGIKHIYDSRTTLFKEQILRDTEGYGVDVVINAIAGDALIHSFNLLAAFGRFIEIGKKDIAENNLLPMQAFNRNLVFAAVDIDRMLMNKLETITAMSQTLLALFETNVLKPMPINVFKARDVKNAFQCMAKSEHIGKIVLDYKDQSVQAVLPERELDKQATYIVTGGTSGFGLEVGYMLAKAGAQKVYLLSRSGKLKDTLPYPNLEVRALDVSDKKALQTLLQEIKQSAYPLKGIVHSAMVLEDASLSQLQKNQFEAVLQPKMAGALNLHEFTQENHLDFFLLFSSISTLIGNPGQASYVVANSFLEALAEKRIAAHLPCTVINWGVFNEVGVVARNHHLSGLLEKSGISGFATEKALQLLKNILPSSISQLGIFSMDWALWSRQYKKMANKSAFQSLIIAASESGEKTSSDYEKLLSYSIQERMTYLTQFIRHKLALVLKVKSEQIDDSATMTSYGMDSLLAIELVNSLKMQLGIAIAPMDFMDGQTVKELAESLSMRF